MRCRVCGNNDRFIEASKCVEMVFYMGTNEVIDSKGIDIESVDDPRECGECGSTDIDEYGTARMTLTGL